MAKGCCPACQPGHPAYAGRDQQPESKCWSCKAPVTLKQWQDADGTCPHCGVEIEGAEGLNP